MLESNSAAKTWLSGPLLLYSSFTKIFMSFFLWFWYNHHFLELIDLNTSIIKYWLNSSYFCSYLNGWTLAHEVGCLLALLHRRNKNTRQSFRTRSKQILDRSLSFPHQFLCNTPITIIEHKKELFGEKSFVLVVQTELEGRLIVLFYPRC